MGSDFDKRLAALAQVHEQQDTAARVVIYPTGIDDDQMADLMAMAHARHPTARRFIFLPNNERDSLPVAIPARQASEQRGAGRGTTDQLILLYRALSLPAQRAVGSPAIGAEAHRQVVSGGNNLGRQCAHLRFTRGDWQEGRTLGTGSGLFLSRFPTASHSPASRPLSDFHIPNGRIPSCGLQRGCSLQHWWV